LPSKSQSSTIGTEGEGHQRVVSGDLADREGVARSQLHRVKWFPVWECLVRGSECWRFFRSCLLRVGHHDVRRDQDDDQRNHHSHVDPQGGPYLSTAVTFRPILSLRLGDRLPLHIAGGIGTTAFKGDDVVDHVSRTTAWVARLSEEL